MREHASAYTSHRANIKPNMPMSASPTAMRHHTRRNSETSARTKHNSKFLTLPMSSSLSHIRRGTVDSSMMPHTPQKLLRTSAHYYPHSDQTRNRTDSGTAPQSPNDSPLSASSTNRPHVNKNHKSYPGLEQDAVDHNSEDASFGTPERPHTLAEKRSCSDRGVQHGDVSYDGQLTLLE